MHSEHRRRYHLRPLADVHPGDSVITDRAAIDAVTNDRADEVDWDQVEQDAAQVLDRHRPQPYWLTFDVRRPQRPVTGIEGHPATSLLVSKPPNAI
jgi:hypothetical protein